MIVRFSVHGEPATQGSFVPVSSTRIKADSKRLAAWRRDVGWSAKAARPRGFQLWKGPIAMSAVFLVAGHDKDLDKMLRAVFDALKGVLYEDDKQVRALVARVQRIPAGSRSTPGIELELCEASA